MPEPVVIKAEPATLQVRSAAMASASPSEHVLIVGQDDTSGTTEYHFSCSCGNFGGSHHTDAHRIETLHAEHVAKKREAANG